MINKSEAERIVLDHVSRGSEERFVIQSCELSEDRAFWIVRANSAAYVESGDFSRCYLGVNAFLVAVQGGEIETVPSGNTVEAFLEQKGQSRLPDDAPREGIVAPPRTDPDRSNKPRGRGSEKMAGQEPPDIETFSLPLTWLLLAFLTLAAALVIWLC